MKIRRVLIFTFLITLLTASVCGQALQRQCSSPTNDLQLCTTTPSISVKSGESISVRLIIKNLSRKPVTVIKARFDDIYFVKVTDFKGGRVASINELLTEKSKNHPGEMVPDLPLNSSPQKIQLAPGEELKIEYNLRYFYDLKTKGKYQVEISRKVPKYDATGEAELSLGTIEIEVK